MTAVPAGSAVSVAASGAASPTRRATEQDGPWRSELLDLVRGASGGLLFGVPLLYTMEVWWTGTTSRPPVMLAVLALLTVPVFALNRTGGFRASRDRRLGDAAADTIEAIALGLVVTAGVLVLLREITPETPIAAALGKVVFESLPFCLGIGVARHFLHGDRADDDDEDTGAESSPSTPRSDRAPGEDRSEAAGPDDESDDKDDGDSGGTIADLGASTIGAVFVAVSIAPTDEVPMIASAMTPAWLMVMVGASLVVSYAIVFVAGFTRQDRRHSHRGIFQRPITETVVCYLLALLAALVLLWCFQRGLHPWTDVLTRVVVLGVPAAIGGAAGRLAI